MNPRFCICGRLGPVTPDDHLNDDWMRIDPDGPGGADSLWLCPNHREESPAELGGRIQAALMRAGYPASQVRA